MNESHPIWGIIRLSVIMTALTATLYLNASNFDETELKTILTMFFIGAGGEGLPKVVAMIRGKGAS